LLCDILFFITKLHNYNVFCGWKDLALLAEKTVSNMIIID